MKMNDERKLAFAKAYSRLKGLRQNTPVAHEVEAKYVEEFHSILTDLESASEMGLWEFRIPSDQLRPTLLSSNYLTGETRYSSENYCERNYLLMKVDGVLSLFAIVPPEREVKQIGFGKP